MSTDALAAFTPRAFGWRAGRKAAHAVRAATDQLRRADDPDGAVKLVTQLWPACMQVNRAHGDLDDAVERAAEQLCLLWLDHATDPAAHDARLDALWAAVQADRAGITDPFAERWGALCATKARANAWAKRLLPSVRKAWLGDPDGRCAAALPCLSALAFAKKGPQLLAMFAVGGPKAWRLRHFAAPFVVRRDGPDGAVAFAEASTARSHAEQQDRAAFCERTLIAAGRRDEAWAHHAVAAHQTNTHRHTFDALRQAWPKKTPSQVLDALLAAHPGEEGKLFATARAMGDPDRATALAEASPGDPKVVLHAAEEEAAAHPARAERWLFIALGWLADGKAYKVTRPIVEQACRLADVLGAQTGERARLRAKLAAVAAEARTAGVHNWVALYLEAEGE